MKNRKAIDVLNQCIEQIGSMTSEEFLKIKEQRGILNKEYNLKEYISEDKIFYYNCIKTIERF